MRIDFVGHACIVVTSAAGQTLLVDPWLAEPVFASRWYRYPPQDPGRVPRAPDVLCLSHAHPDHSGVQTLRQLTPGWVLQCAFSTQHLARRAERYFPGRLTQLDPWQRHPIEAGWIATVPNDLGWEDASFIFEVDGVRVYHGNDNPLRPETYTRVAAELGPIDIALLPFAGASSYPTCFDWPADAIAKAAQGKKEEALDRFRDGVRGLRPRIAVPFASHWALFEAGFVERNWTDRYTVNEAAERAAKEFPDVRILPVAPGDAWAEDFIPGPDHDRWQQTIPTLERYVAEHGAAARRVDEAATPEDYDCVEAQLRQIAERITLSSPARICVASPLVIWTLEIGSGRISRSKAPDADETIFVADADLRRLARGKERWEDLWYGYAVRVSKRAGTPYYRAFWEALLEYEAPGFESLGE